VKGKRPNSILEHVDEILPGDAILSINGDGETLNTLNKKNTHWYNSHFKQ